MKIADEVFAPVDTRMLLDPDESGEYQHWKAQSKRYWEAVEAGNAIYMSQFDAAYDYEGKLFGTPKPNPYAGETRRVRMHDLDDIEENRDPTRTVPSSAHTYDFLVTRDDVPTSGDNDGWEPRGRSAELDNFIRGSAAFGTSHSTSMNHPHGSSWRSRFFDDRHTKDGSSTIHGNDTSVARATRNAFGCLDPRANCTLPPVPEGQAGRLPIRERLPRSFDAPAGGVQVSHQKIARMAPSWFTGMPLERPTDERRARNIHNEDAVESMIYRETVPSSQPSSRDLTTGADDYESAIHMDWSGVPLSGGQSRTSAPIRIAIAGTERVHHPKVMTAATKETMMNMGKTPLAPPPVSVPLSDVIITDAQLQRARNMDTPLPPRPANARTAAVAAQQGKKLVASIPEPTVVQNTPLQPVVPESVVSEARHPSTDLHKQPNNNDDNDDNDDDKRSRYRDVLGLILLSGLFLVILSLLGFGK